MASLDGVAFGGERSVILHKLLLLGPESLPEIVRCTGWREDETKTVLERLISNNKVKKRRAFRGSIPLYQAIDN